MTEEELIEGIVAGTLMFMGERRDCQEFASKDEEQP